MDSALNYRGNLPFNFHQLQKKVVGTPISALLTVRTLCPNILWSGAVGSSTISAPRPRTPAPPSPFYSTLRRLRIMLIPYVAWASSSHRQLGPGRSRSLSLLMFISQAQMPLHLLIITTGRRCHDVTPHTVWH